MSHNFLPSIKKGVKYCSYCGCLSYNSIPSKETICQFKNQYFIGFDPLLVKYKPISLHIDFSLLSHRNYINNREKGLLKIYFLSNKFNLSEMIKYKAIGSMENSQNSHPLNNNSYVNIKNVHINNLKSLYQYIKDETKNIMYWQTYCLEKLDYNLGKYSAYDYLNLFFDLGIVFTKEKINILNIFESCFNILELIITKSNICRFNQYVIAMSLIYIQFINTNYFDRNTFKYIYGVDFSKKKYKLCINELNILIKNTFNKQPCINKDVNYYFKHHNNDEDNNDYKNNNFSDRNINIVNNNRIINSNNSIFRELSFQYTYIYEQIKLRNYLNIYNDINNIYYKYSYLSLSGHKNDKLVPNYKLNNFGLNLEDIERKISLKNKEVFLK